MFTDTHTHLADPIFSSRLSNVLQQAQQAGITRFIVPATQTIDWQPVLALKATNIIPAIGLHPWFVTNPIHHDFTQLNTLLSQYSNALVGEIGLDYHHATDPITRQQQQIAFITQLHIAQQHHRPIILHNLRATYDVIRLIKQVGFQQGGFAHAFSGSLEEARSLIAHGFLIGIGTLLLNPCAKKVRHAASTLPLEYLVLETDSPFMLPHHRNQPANVRLIAEIICQLRGLSLNQLAKQTEHNINTLLNRLLL